MAFGTVVAPLRRADFRRLWTAQSVSIVGDKVNQVALSLLVYRLTGSLAQMGLVFAITFLPAALFGLVAGPCVDRWDRRRTMIASDLIRAVLVLLVPFALSFGLPAVYFVAFLVATVSLFFQPARMALVPLVVEECELMAANSLDSITESVAELMGLAFGGALVVLLAPQATGITGFRYAFYIDAATYIVSAAFITVVAHRAVRVVSAAPWHPMAIWDEVRDGLRRIAGDPVLSLGVASFGLASLGGAAAVTLSLLLALNVYAASGLPDAVRFTTVDAAITVGLLIGGLVVGSSGAAHAGRKYLGGLVAFGSLFFMLAFIHDIRVAAVLFAAVGIANTFFFVPMITILQTHTEDETRGRVFAVRTTIVRVATVVGLAGAGLAAQSFGVLPVVAVVGLFVGAVGALGFVLPRLREA
jgi:MFS transporter, DHA3 family, macrolide efflux protein